MFEKISIECNSPLIRSYLIIYNYFELCMLINMCVYSCNRMCRNINNSFQLIQYLVLTMYILLVCPETFPK